MNGREVSVLTCLFFFMMTTPVKCLSKADQKALQEHLYKNISKNIRPTSNRTQRTDIYVSFYLISLQEFDEKRSLISVFGAFGFHWIADDMKWNPYDYGGEQYTSIPQDDLWVPQILPMAPYDKFEMVGDNLKRNSVRLIYDGTVYWTAGDVYRHVCAADVTYYPLDTQHCTLMFKSWSFLKYDLCFTSIQPTMDLQEYRNNNLWELLNTTVSVTERDKSCVLSLSIKFKRRSFYYIVNIILPIMTISLLNVLVFLLPVESGERVGFAITVLLALAVFLTIVSDKLPETSQPNISLMSFFLFGDLMINTLITVFTVIGLHYHFKKKEEYVPTFHRYVALSYLSLCCQRCSRRQLGTEDTKRCKQKYIDPVADDHPKVENIDGIFIKGDKQGTPINWTDFALAFDFYCFILFSFLIVSKHCAFLIGFTIQSDDM